MDDLTQRYYEAEMRHLRKRAKNLRKHPTVLRCLISINPATRSLGSACSRASLPMGPPARKAGRHLPELTEGLVSLLWL